MKLADLVASGGYVVATGRTIGTLPLNDYTAQRNGAPGLVADALHDLRRKTRQDDPKLWSGHTVPLHYVRNKGRE